MAITKRIGEYMASEKYRSKSHALLLYPDCPEHVEAMEKIKQSYDYLAILHDRDYFTAEDEKKNPDHKQGTLKKPHWHVVLRFNNQTWSSAIVKELGIKDNFIDNVRKFDNAVAYLIHMNDEDKAQYEESEVFGTFKNRLNEIINKADKTEGEKVVELIEFIQCQAERITITDFATFCAKNGYWAEFRRSGAIFCKMIDEHNEKVSKIESV